MIVSNKDNPLPFGGEDLSPEDRAERILSDIEALRDADPARFRQVAQRVAEVADGHARALTGDNHPLAEILRRKRDPESARRLAEGMAEFRARVEAAELAEG